MNDTIIIFINGAPRSGKDTMADQIEKVDAISDFPIYKLPMKEHLIHQTRVFFDIGMSEWEERYELLKDEPWARTFGMSQRQALIWMSEEVARPKFGKDFYGHIHAEYIEDMVMDDAQSLVVLPDSGFVEELYPVMNKFGKENCFMINTFRTGTSFENDSRSLITGDMLGIKGFEFVNRGTIADVKKAADTIIDEILSTPRVGWSN